MAIADRRVKPDTRTKFEKWLDSLSDKNRAVVLAWLMDADVSHTNVADWIREDDAEDDFTGYRATKGTVSEWRRTHGAR